MSGSESPNSSWSTTCSQVACPTLTPLPPPHFLPAAGTVSSEALARAEYGHGARAEYGHARACQGRVWACQANSGPANPSTGVTPEPARCGRASAGGRRTGGSGSASMRTAQKLVCSYRQEGLDLLLDFGSHVGPQRQLRWPEHRASATAPSLTKLACGFEWTRGSML